MRLVKKLNDDEVYQIKHREWLSYRFAWVTKKIKPTLEQVCEPPKMGKVEVADTPAYHLSRIVWSSHTLLRILAPLPVKRLRKIIIAIHSLTGETDNNTMRTFKKPHLVDYILDTTYDLGWTQENKEEEKNHEVSKSSKQKTRKKASRGKRTVGRPKKKPAEIH